MTVTTLPSTGRQRGSLRPTARQLECPRLDYACGIMRLQSGEVPRGHFTENGFALGVAC